MAISGIIQWYSTRKHFNIPGYKAEYSVIDDYAFDTFTIVIKNLRQNGIDKCSEVFGSIDFSDLTTYASQSVAFKQAVGEVSDLREICIKSAFPEVVATNDSFEP